MEKEIILTHEKLKEFESYHGDEEMWTRARKSKSLLSNSEWHLLDGIIQKIFLISKGLASQSYQDELRRELEKAAPDKALQEKIWSLGISNFGMNPKK